MTRQRASGFPSCLLLGSSWFVSLPSLMTEGFKTYPQPPFSRNLPSLKFIIRPGVWWFSATRGEKRKKPGNKELHNTTWRLSNHKGKGSENRTIGYDTKNTLHLRFKFWSFSAFSINENVNDQLFLENKDTKLNFMNLKKCLNSQRKAH